MVERAPATDQRNVLRARNKHVVATRRNEPKPVDGVGLACDDVAQAELGERRASFRGDGAATGFVARKIKAIDEDHAIHPELAQAHGGREASGASTDDADLGVNDCVTAGGALSLSHPGLDRHDRTTGGVVFVPARYQQVEARLSRIKSIDLVKPFARATAENDILAAAGGGTQ